MARLGVAGALVLSWPASATAKAGFAASTFWPSLAVLLLHEPVTPQLLMAAGLMALGVWLHLAEHHVHEHGHEDIAHSHEHVHDEHHQHAHDPSLACSVFQSLQEYRPMPKLIQTLIVWLFMLSLPLQGVAAVTMASCGPGHKHPLAQSQVHADHGEHGGHGDHPHSMADGHGHGQHPQINTMGKAATQGADKCSACASCCTGVAMVAPVLRWQTPMHEPAVHVVLPSLGQPSFHPDGLDRPPRSSFA